MDPFTIALATFGIQKLRGKSTKRSLRDAAIAGGIGQVAGMAGFGSTMGPNMGSFAPTAFGNTGNFIGRQAAIEAGTGQVAQQTLGSQASQAAGGIYDMGKNLIGQPDKYNKAGTEILTEGSGFRGLSTGAQLGIGLGASTLLAGEDDPVEPPEGTKQEDYDAAKVKADAQLQGILNKYDYEADAAGVNQTQSPYNYTDNSLYSFSKGGIAEIKKFNKGGINYLPSMTDHDKDDEGNYIRAMGYVEDGSGNGDKDEDTMLAQLADGEFVSRADAILGAGIIEGGDPSSYKDMRKKGAAFFYGQQARFKRVFDLLDAARKEKN
tara:strand:- start:449 stop:1414 length:966 start_codon:yes stop_codon:yes gene_type:complete